MKSLKVLTLALALGIPCLTQQAQAQKIGYANLEQILASMPEYKQVESALTTYQKKVQEELNVKQSYAQGKVEEYTSLQKAGKLTPEQDEAKVKELRGLDDEIKKFAEEQDGALSRKRDELLAPVVAKMKTAMEDVARTEGYPYVLNYSSGGVLASIPVAPAADNLTDRIAKKLGITLVTLGSKSGDASAATTTPAPAQSAPAKKP